MRFIALFPIVVEWYSQTSLPVNTIPNDTIAAILVLKSSIWDFATGNIQN